MDVDYWHFTFDDQIATENTTQLASDLTTTLDPTKVIRSPSAGTGDVQRCQRRSDRWVQYDVHQQRDDWRPRVSTSASPTPTISAASGRCVTRCMTTYQTNYEINGVNAEGSRNSRVAGASFAVPWRATLRERVGRWETARCNRSLRFTDSLRQRCVTECRHRGQAVRGVVSRLGCVLRVRHRRALWAGRIRM